MTPSQGDTDALRLPKVGAGSGFTVAEAPEESTRFARSVRRYAFAAGDPAPLLAHLRSEPVDLAIVRLPAGRLDVLQRLSGVGCEVLVCDCLVLYRREPLGECDRALAPIRGLQTRLASAADASAIRDLVLDSFRGYRNHYALNPRLPAVAAAEAYADWIGRYLDVEGRCCLLGMVDGEPAAFGSLRFDDGETEIVLGGVAERFQGRGVYRDLLRAMVREGAIRGHPSVVVSTQLTNVAVQRVWVAEDFRLAESFLTVHLNF